MHKEKVSGMSHEGFFYQEHKRNLYFGNFLGCLFLTIIQIPTYLMSFINN
jgi:hypothetical protein